MYAPEGVTYPNDAPISDSDRELLASLLWSDPTSDDAPGPAGLDLLRDVARVSVSANDLDAAFKAAATAESGRDLSEMR